MTTIHALCVVAQREEACSVCHACRAAPCACARPGVHLCRVCLAADHGYITLADLAGVMRGLGRCYGSSVLPDPGGAL